MAKKLRKNPTVYQSKIAELGKYLTVFNLPDVVVPEVDNRKVHHVQIIDRSGSMYYEIKDLIKDVQKTLDIMKPGDAFSVYWFSGPKENGPILVQGTVKEDGSLDAEKAIIAKFASTLSTTCFSEVFEKVYNDLKAFHYDVTQITLFTDGNPVVDWSEQEEWERVARQIKYLINNPDIKLASFNAVGYGDYCNLNELQKLSELTQNGITVHADKISQYFYAFQSNVLTVRDISTDELYIEYCNDDTKIVYSSNNLIQEILPTAPTTLDMECVPHVSLSKTKNQVIILSDDTKPMVRIKCFSYDWNFLVPMYEWKKIPSNFIDGYLYKIAYAVSDQNLSNEIIDKVLQDNVARNKRVKAWTPTEKFDYRKTYLKDLAFSAVNRRPESTINAMAAPSCSVISFITKLVEFSKAHPGSIKYLYKKTGYKRIGVPTDSIKNIHDISPEGNILFFVTNRERLNASLMFSVSAKAPIGSDDAKKLCIDEDLPVTMYKTHTIIKDGQLNMKSLTIKVISNSLAFYDMLNDQKITHLSYIKSYGMREVEFTFDLTSFSLIESNEYESADEIAMIVNLRTLKVCQEKALKYLIDKDKEVGYIPALLTNTKRSFGEDELEFLKRYGIRYADGTYVYDGFDKKPIPDDKCDFYMAPIMEFYPKGQSSIPSVNAAIKNNAPSGQLIRDALEMYRDYTLGQLTEELKGVKKARDKYDYKLMEIRMKYAFNGMVIPGFEQTSKPDIMIYEPTQTILKYGYRKEKVLAEA